MDRSLGGVYAMMAFLDKRTSLIGRRNLPRKTDVFVSRYVGYSHILVVSTFLLLFLSFCYTPFKIVPAIELRWCSFNPVKVFVLRASLRAMLSE